jgi:polysaccharide export outer membrane protein
LAIKLEKRLKLHDFSFFSGTTMRNLQRSVSIWLLLLLGACASLPPVESGKKIVETSDSPVLEREFVTVPVGAEEAPLTRDYHLGQGDVLFINSYGLPQMGGPAASAFGEAGEGKNAGLAAGQLRSRVDGAGNIYLPWIGGVEVAGLTVAQTQEKLRQALRFFVKDPWVVVDVAEFKSQPLYLLGEFNKPGTYYMDRTLTLLEGLAQGNGFEKTADLRGARLLRGEKTYPVDIYRLLRDGDPKQNIRLKSGDILFIPDDKDKHVFVFGAVQKPGMVPMNHGRLNLAQALAVAEFDLPQATSENIRIIRSLSPTQGELLVVDLTRSLKGESLPFALMEGDIIYVPRSRVGNWNQAIQELVPSLQLVSNILQPFVQLKFLSDN